MSLDSSSFIQTMSRKEQIKMILEFENLTSEKEVKLVGTDSHLEIKGL